LEQVASLPFKYYELDSDKVIDAVLRAAGWRPYSFFKTTGVVRVPLTLTDGQPAGVSLCSVTLTKGPGGKRRLLIER